MQKHILLIPSWYPEDSKSISGSFFREQALALRKRGIKVGVIYPQITPIKKKIKKYGFDKVIDCEVNTYRFYYYNITPRIDFLIKFLWLRIGMYLFKKYVSDNGLPDLIHVHSSMNAGYLAFLIKKQYGIKYILTEHSSYFITNKLSIQKIKSLKPIFNNSEYCLSVSDFFKDKLNNIFNTCKWIYLPNMVNDNFQISKNNKLNLKNNKFIFLSVSSVDSNKNIELLVKSFSLLNLKDTCLFIVGNGPELINIKKLVADLKLNHKIKFFGTVNRESVKNIIASSNVIVSTSNFETFGVVLIEALSLGKPIISTRSGGPESIVNHKVGLLVNKNSVEELTKAMNYIYMNYDDYDPLFLKSYCKNNFSEDVIVNRLIEIYNDS